MEYSKITHDESGNISIVKSDIEITREERFNAFFDEYRILCRRHGLRVGFRADENYGGFLEVVEMDKDGPEVMIQGF